MLYFKIQKKSLYCFRQNWKAISLKRFDNILKKLLLELLLYNLIKKQHINKYTIKLLNILKKTIKKFTLYTRLYTRIKLK